MKIRAVGSKMFLAGRERERERERQTDRHDETNSPF